ncbi:hypothetical protein EXIGLDRAFT_846227 [Exidia glandulosa HHB12029]|uniref:BTB domain-containing protein n=1 Tax=Exidia glandulosa HHB12029 TaxID=1314781 RepID=A0A165B3T9_EXIGL|nr:hypothetical protein EXIGLDRAFT_846227 [Exidia glandulosa HHB12029]
MMDKYTVTLRGEPFTLYRDQIEFDSPNYFTSIFLGDFAESQTRSVELSRSPNLFRIIVNYLSGYTILPLTATVIPTDMTFDMARTNLLRDAEFFGLRGLVALLHAPGASSNSPQTVQSLAVAYQSLALGHQVVQFGDLLRGNLPPGVLCDNRGVGSLQSEKWYPIPIKASGMIVVDWPNPDLVVKTTLTDPLAHETLSATLTRRGLQVPMTTYHLDGTLFQAMLCTILPSAHVTVDGIDAVGMLGETYSRASASASSNVDGGKDSNIDGLTRALQRIWKAEDTKQSFVYAAEEIVFTIRPSAKSPPIEVCILAARFVSRANAASRLL